MKKDPKVAQSMRWHEAVELLVRIAAIEDPERLRPGDALNLVDDLGRFLEVEGEGRVAQELSQARARPTKLRAVIEAVRSLVEAAADHRRVEMDIGAMRVALDGSRLGDERGAEFWDGSLRDVVASVAAGDLGAAEPWQICRCRGADCRKLYLAGRKGQTFCCHSCASAAATASYQERKKRSSRKGDRR